MSSVSAACPARLSHLNFRPLVRALLSLEKETGRRHHRWDVASARILAIDPHAFDAIDQYFFAAGAAGLIMFGVKHKKVTLRPGIVLSDS